MLRAAREIKTGIIGASGYTGAELLRIMSVHPALKLEYATADSQAGQEIETLYPHLKSYSGHKFVKYTELGSSLNDADLIFCALPHGEAMKVLPNIKDRIIIDLGGDFRLDDAVLYTKWYKHEHTAGDQMSKWQYGLTELFREQIKNSKLISNPGCYPTAPALPVSPLFKENLVEGVVTINAMSGTSGAGRVASAGMHVSHVLEDVRAYKVAEHQHTPEIEMAIKKYSGKEVLVSFTPHLMPMVRGINATCSVKVKPGVTADSLYECLYQVYKNEKFVSVSRKNAGTKEVRASNYAVISVFLDQRTSQAILTCVIDNLVKGASGQAIQNANLVFGLDESLGLEQQGVYP